MNTNPSYGRVIWELLRSVMTNAQAAAVQSFLKTRGYDITRNKSYPISTLLEGLKKLCPKDNLLQTIKTIFHSPVPPVLRQIGALLQEHVEYKPHRYRRMQRRIRTTRNYCRKSSPGQSRLGFQKHSSLPKQTKQLASPEREKAKRKRRRREGN